jgi:steroid delta-isomerase-like uncharacterized protein
MAATETTALETRYRCYIDCLNRQDWAALEDFVAADVQHNGRPFGLAGYRAMLEADFCAIPDLFFDVALLVANATHVAARLQFDCTPTAAFLGLPVNGRRVRFAENVFYSFAEGKITAVWSVVDKAAIEAQIT